jgi:predicted HTH transcriptional regulator
MDTPTNNNKLNIYDVAIFKDSPSLAYLYKKTEKLVSALYLLSNFISDKEPIKWQIRETGIELLSQSLSASVSDRNLVISSTLKLLSYLNIAHIGGVISEMNYQILKAEFEVLIQEPKNIIFPEHFFEVEQKPVLPVNNSKGQSTVSDKLSVTKSLNHNDEKSNRQQIILSLLKRDKELGIKDFVSSITDCSEKTIQRELATLVSKGQIKKEGEKRWSRYSIK